MHPALIGKKIGMTQVFDETGKVHPVTVVEAGPCVVLAIKTPETDGYNAVQLGFEDVKPQRAKKPQVGHAAKAKARPKKRVRELRVDNGAVEAELGETWTVEAFEGVTHVDVVGTSKGKGFAGVMKRYHFKGQLASHGVERKHRSGGSISSHGTDLGHGGNIKKGKRMAGHMGAVREKTRKCKLVQIDRDNNLLLIRGAVPGPNGGYVFVMESRTAKAAK